MAPRSSRRGAGEQIDVHARVISVDHGEADPESTVLPSHPYAWVRHVRAIVEEQVGAARHSTTLGSSKLVHHGRSERPGVDRLRQPVNVDGAGAGAGRDAEDDMP